MKRVLNLGAGTQSSVILLMSDRGEIEPVDVAVFADTGWEPREVYEHLNWLRCEVKNTRIEVVHNNRNIYEDSIKSQVKLESGKWTNARWGSMPFFVKNTDGSRGMIRRQCTSEYKIEPIRRFIKTEVLGLAKYGHWPKHPVVTQVFGISVDEYQRQRAPEGAWVLNDYPLIRMRWPRGRTIQWAEENYPNRVFPRSACIGCPFHSDAEWLNIKNGDPKEWQEVVDLDSALRNAKGFRGEVFLHSSLRPIDEIDFRSSDEKNGQLRLWQDECEGMCGV